MKSQTLPVIFSLKTGLKITGFKEIKVETDSTFSLRVFMVAIISLCFLYTDTTNYIGSIYGFDISNC